MQSRSRSLQVTRRQLLQSAASASLAVSVAGPAILGRAQAQQKTVSFAGWAFEPQVVEANVKRFMEQNKDLAVKYMPLDLQLYNEKMVALINANNDPDCFYVRDTNLGAWVEAGWVQPIDGMPNLDELNKDIFAFNLDAMSYKGKQYGTPYYGDIYVYMYDQKALQKANVAKAPVTLDELKAAALEVKKAGIAKYPILKGFKTNVDGLSEFWSMVLASGGKMFNEALDPVYPNEDKTALGVLEWMVEAMHGSEILDPTGLELDETQARDVFLSGQGVFTSNVGNVMPRANNPQHSKRAGDIKMTQIPRPCRCRQGADGLVAPLLHQLQDQDEERGLACDLLHGRQGRGRQILHGQGLVSEVRRWLCLQVHGHRSRHHRCPESRRLRSRHPRPSVRHRQGAR